ncbi:MAG: leucine-rich repeat domain-containing protein [Bacteroidales bacterium]|nr:leucine-rich repeat domain-containing protein [Bacteroidales bacterium]
MEKQPANYSFGIKLYDLENKDCDFDWEEWADAKDFQHLKVKEQIKWIIAAEDCPYISEDKYQPLFDKIVDPDELDYSIVWDRDELAVGKYPFAISPFGGMNPNDNQIFYTYRYCREELEHTMRHYRHWLKHDNKLIGSYGVIMFDKPITHIDRYWFDELMHLHPFYHEMETVSLPNSVKTIDTGAFLHCDNLRAFYSKFASDDHRCLIVNGELVAFAPAGLTKYSIPDGVTSIGESAFEHCRNLEQVFVPKSTTIAEDAFDDCDKVKIIRR